jgi:hypothetical protein
VDGRNLTLIAALKVNATIEKRSHWEGSTASCRCSGGRLHHLYDFFQILLGELLLHFEATSDRDRLPATTVEASRPFLLHINQLPQDVSSNRGIS